MKPFLLVLSAPSGGGKTTIARELGERRKDIGFSISATTRAPRGREMDGVEYYFLSPEEFKAKIDAGEFLEWAEYGGKRYGTLHSEVERLLDQGKHVVLDIEVQGAHAVRERLADRVVTVFILPPSAAVLRERLAGRETEDPAGVKLRLETAVGEIAEAGSYDYVVINDDRERAVSQVETIIEGEMLKSRRRDNFEGEIAGFVAELGEFIRDMEER
ncbi:MAG: guanylate kinase [Gemmatimonadota bacterium]|nr:guanylate kinase [Gemmatimonadota bacterium]MDH5805770.1 guanylate kinase [Gemmatimonadota bacterium]